MTNVVNLFGPKSRRSSQISEPVIPSATEPNLHIKEPEDYYLSDVALGIEIALQLTQDHEVAKFLLKKLEQAVNSRQLWVSLNLHETRKYLDYLDIVNSQRNRDLRLALAKFKYTG